MAKKLTPKQELFCREYLVSLDAKAAYLKVYKCSEAAADSNATRLMGHDGCKAFIAQLQKPMIKKLEVKADFVLQELMHMAGFDIAEAYNKDGSLKNIHDMPVEIRKCIKSVETIEVYEGSGADRIYIGDTKKIHFWPKDKALEMLGRHKKLFTDLLEIKDSSKLAERLGRARDRVKK